MIPSINQWHPACFNPVNKLPRSKQAVRYFDNWLPCHSEFISESLSFNVLLIAEILKQVQDDNCRTVSKPRGINSSHSRGLLIGNPETRKHCTFLDTRWSLPSNFVIGVGYDNRGKPRGIKPEDKNKRLAINYSIKQYAVSVIHCLFTGIWNTYNTYKYLD